MNRIDIVGLFTLTITFLLFFNLITQHLSLALTPKDKPATIDNHTSSLQDIDRLKKYSQSLQYYDKALSIEPNATDILTNKGIFLIKLGNYSEAIQYFDRALNIDPNNVGGLYNKAIALDRLGKHEEARTYQHKALELNPTYTSDFTNILGKLSAIAPPVTINQSNIDKPH